MGNAGRRIGIVMLTAATGAVSSCGGSDDNATTGSRSSESGSAHVTVYSSLPFDPADRQQSEAM
jgi:hypothetical protein